MVENRTNGDAGATARANALAARERLAATAARMVDEKGRPSDSRWWFTNSYVRTTEGAIEEADAGSFADAAFIFRLITYFEKLYFDNLLAADEGRWVEPHWQRAFDVAANADARRRVSARVRNGTADQSSLRAVVASVVASSRAHIRFDLPRAMAWVHASPVGGSGAEPIATRIGDFMAMAAVFERATVAANSEVARYTGLPVQYMPTRLQEWGMRFVFRADLIHERAYAWECAEALAAAGGAGENPYTEPEAGRLVGDVTVAQKTDSFAGIAAELRPTMDGLRRAPQDAPSRAAAEFPDDLDTVGRIRALQGLCHGHTGRADQKAIITLLAATARLGDFVAVVNGVGAWELAVNLFGREKRALRTLLRTYYYPQVQPSVATALIRRAIRFAELNWEETMVADLLCDRPDAAALLTAIGGDERAGWRRIDRDLGREARARVLTAKPELG